MHHTKNITPDLDQASESQELVRDALNEIVTGRKSWKTLKGRTEAVWPPFLEAALIEGLEKYRVTEGLRSTGFGGGRYPMRNRFISEHIYNATGKRRTPKQVGSRLQQLRDTVGGKRVLKILSERSDGTASRPSTSRPTSSRRSESPSLKRPTLSPRPALGRAAHPAPRTVVEIPIAYHYHHSNPPSPSTSNPNSPLSSTFPSSARLPPHRGVPRVRSIHCIDPTLTFLSRCALPDISSDSSSYYYALFTVFFDGDNTPLHTETGPLDLVRGPSQVRPHAQASQLDLVKLEESCYPLDGVANIPFTLPVQPSHPRDDGDGFLYRTTLIPKFWDHLCQSPDPTRYSIVQEIVCAQRSASKGLDLLNGDDLGTHRDVRTVVLSVECRFSYPTPPPPDADPGYVSSGRGDLFRFNVTDQSPVRNSPNLTLPSDLHGRNSWDYRPSTSSSTSSWASETLSNDFSEDDLDPDLVFNYMPPASHHASAPQAFTNVGLPHTASLPDLSPGSLSIEHSLPVLPTSTMPNFGSFSPPTTPLDANYGWDVQGHYLPSSESDMLHPYTDVIHPPAPDNPHSTASDNFDWDNFNYHYLSFPEDEAKCPTELSSRCYPSFGPSQ
ncbi:hypothetical protein JAAARDRAFT_79440 [Jaapia argillacea MUCL 33604]|uniref:TEA domain-containing protein n=1 Tax=Jaapia argillacea MUCL 33604 TaxID=933084 RepID=A0A067PRL3_9AGAM|nr:hypothetical protein JAAARDRAFT_79440 [Jaapia argillacea MUCL 33604]